jgi:hypothetical protein
MKLKLTRRQFGQVVLVSTTAAAVGTFVSKTFAQQSSTLILGARPGDISNSNTSSPAVNLGTTDKSDETKTKDMVPSSLQTIVVESFDVSRQKVNTELTTSPILQAGEQLSGLVFLKDGRLVVAATNFNGSKKNAQNVRLISLREPPTIIAISGLKNNEAIYQLLTLNDGSLAALVGKNNGNGSFRIATINPDTGTITDRNTLPAQKRVTAIAQCPDGIFYGITTEKTGETSLFQVGQEQSKILKFNGSSWNNGFSALVCSSSNQLFALGGLRYESPFYLHLIDKNNGEIQRIEMGFDVATIAAKS